MTLPCGGTACSKCGKCLGGSSCRTIRAAHNVTGAGVAAMALGMVAAPFTGGLSLALSAGAGIGGAAVATDAAAHKCKC